MVEEQARGAHETQRKEATAPDPDDPRKPDSPAEITRPSWRYVFKRAAFEFTSDGCTDLAAALTYFAVLSLFPALLAVLSLLGTVGQGEATADWIIGFLRANAPAELATLMDEPIRQIATQGGSGIALVTGILGAVWAASGYVGAFGRAMNKVYEVEEGRPAWVLRPVQVLVTLALLVLIVVVLGLFLLAGPLGEATLGRTVATTIGWVSWPAAGLAGVVVLAVLYYATPNVRQPRFRWISVGALVALVGMTLAAVGFTFYVANFSKYNAMYGTVGSVIVLLLGLWIMGNLMLFGAEVDAELERGRELQAGIVAEETLQLPPRDTRQVERTKRKSIALVGQGRRLRRTRGTRDTTPPDATAPDAAARDTTAPDAAARDTTTPDAEAPVAAASTARDWYADPQVRAQVGLGPSARDR